MISNDSVTPKLLGRLHSGDHSFENLFICECGNSIWIKNLIESSRQVTCSRCSCAFLLVKKKDKYDISVQNTLW